MFLTKEIVINDLKILKDEKYQQFSKKLSPDTTYEIIGVRTPALKQLAKTYKKYDISKYLEDTNFIYLEECLVYGMLLNHQKQEFNQIRPYIERYITKISGWAICDLFCADMKIAKKDLDTVWNFITPYIYKEHEFEVRFAVVMILDHYITYERLPEIIKLIEDISITSYYVQMAIAWLLATCFIKYPDYMLNYLKDNPKLDKFTYNKTLSKITDSLRVSNEYKEIVRKMRR